MLRKGLTFANGDKLTSSHVEFSFDRQQKIASQVGLGMLLHNLVRHATPDATTVVFTLKAANDQIWPQILSALPHRSSTSRCSRPTGS